MTSCHSNKHNLSYYQKQLDSVIPDINELCDTVHNQCIIYTNEFSKYNMLLFDTDTLLVYGGFSSKKDEYESDIEFGKYLYRRNNLDNNYEKLLYLNAPEFKFNIVVRQKYDTTEVNITNNNLSKSIDTSEYFWNMVISDEIICVRSNSTDSEIVELYNKFEGYRKNSH